MYSKYFPALAGQMVESNFPTSSGTRGKTLPNHPKSPRPAGGMGVSECRRAVCFLCLYSAACQSGGKRA